MHHAKQLCAAADIYTTTHDGKLPPADTWPQVIKMPEVPMDRILAGGRPWAMNRLLGGVALTAVPKRGETVLFFECKPGSHPAGGPELVPAQTRREGRYVIGFVDGHAELVAPAELGRLVWNPQVSPTPPAPAPGPVPPVLAPVAKPAPLVTRIRRKTLAFCLALLAPESTPT